MVLQLGLMRVDLWVGYSDEPKVVHLVEMMVEKMAVMMADLMVEWLAGQLVVQKDFRWVVH
jgi:hypothetical protein